MLGQEIQTFIGTLISGHNRQAQMWLNFNAAASEEHQAEVVARSARNTRQQSRLVIIRSDEQTSEISPSTWPRQTIQQDTTSDQSPSAKNFPENSQHHDRLSEARHSEQQERRQWRPVTHPQQTPLGAHAPSVPTATVSDSQRIDLDRPRLGFANCLSTDTLQCRLTRHWMQQHD